MKTNVCQSLASSADCMQDFNFISNRLHLKKFFIFQVSKIKVPYKDFSMLSDSVFLNWFNVRDL